MLTVSTLVLAVTGALVVTVGRKPSVITMSAGERIT
jgi:hypothetical protein